MANWPSHQWESGSPHAVSCWLPGRWCRNPLEVSLCSLLLSRGDTRCVLDLRFLSNGRTLVLLVTGQMELQWSPLAQMRGKCIETLPKAPVYAAGLGPEEKMFQIPDVERMKLKVWEEFQLNRSGFENWV